LGGRVGARAVVRKRRARGEAVRWVTHLRFGSARVCLDHAG
jgi:hypothetical protein